MYRLSALILLFLLLPTQVIADSFSLVSVPYYNIIGYPLVSCISMVLEYYGERFDKEDLKAKVTSLGWEDLFSAVAYLESKGYKVYITQLQIREIKNIINYSEIPVIVGQSFRKPYDYLHWRLVIGFDDQKGLVTNDPVIRSNYILDEDKFKSLWVREAPNITIIIPPKGKKLSIIENSTIKNALLFYSNTRRYVSNSDWKSAKNEIEKYLKIYPDNPIGLNAYAYILLQLGDLEGAKKTINRVLSNYQLHYVYNVAGLIYWKLGEIKTAEQYFSRGYTLSPSNKEIVKNYANFLISQGKLEDAKDILNSYLVLEPEDKEIKDLLNKL
ncbi:MAG: tetratricopeptide repeat protein [bacterium]|nr:tetratricopeptide repeat protein [bacterium]